MTRVTDRQRWPRVPSDPRSMQRCDLRHSQRVYLPWIGSLRHMLNIAGSGEQMEDLSQPALEAFSRWSNYLLVTTVAAVGWISSGVIKFHTELARSLSLWCLGASVVFGIFTLALVPLVAEKARKANASTHKQAEKTDVSIYKIKTDFNIFNLECHAYLTQACRPQHVLFIVGIISYCWGVTDTPWLAAIVGTAAVIYGLFSSPDGFFSRPRGNDSLGTSSSKRPPES